METPKDADREPPSASASGYRVPPYTLTGGRTVANVHLELETMVAASTDDLGHGLDLLPEHEEIIDLCQTPQSVAEISALLKLHLGVARVLTGDLIEHDYLRLKRDLLSERPDLRLLERVLDGLQTL